MAVYQFYRNLLSIDEQRKYDELLSLLSTDEEKIRFPISSFESGQRVVDAVKNDHPEIFYLSGRYLFSQVGFQKVLILEREIPAEESKRMLFQMQSRIRQAFIPIRNLPSAYKKILYVHDWFLKNITYDVTSPRMHSIVGPLMENRGCCQGISLAAKMIFDYLNIPSLVLFGKGMRVPTIMESHAWNVVKIDQEYYHLDITFDLSGKIHAYLNVTDKEVKMTHQYKELPGIRCTETEWNYHVQNRCVFHSLEEAEKFVSAHVFSIGKPLEVKIDSLDNQDYSTRLMQAIRKNGVSIFSANCLKTPCLHVYLITVQ